MRRCRPAQCDTALGKAPSHGRPTNLERVGDLPEAAFDFLQVLLYFRSKLCAVLQQIFKRCLRHGNLGVFERRQLHTINPLMLFKACATMSAVSARPGALIMVIEPLRTRAGTSLTAVSVPTQRSVV